MPTTSHAAQPVPAVGAPARWGRAMLLLCLLAFGALGPGAAPLQPASEPGAETGDAALPECVITLANGTRLEGELVERTEESIVLRIRGVRATYPRKDVARLVVLPPFEDRYGAIKAELAPGDADGHARLAAWLRDRGRWALALDETKTALALDRNNAEARRLKMWLESRLAMREVAGADPASAHAPATDGAVTIRELTDDEINIVRVYELDLHDPPRMNIERDKIAAFMSDYASDPRIPSTTEARELFMGSPPGEVASLMFELQARKHYPSIAVLEDPASVAGFTRDVHAAWLINACATTRCHGGEQAGRLRLVPSRLFEHRAVYTNLVILAEHTLEDGRALIDWNEPARSALLQTGLPRERSLYPHPVVHGSSATRWKPIFRSTDEHRYQRAVEWIASMYRPRPVYPLESPVVTPVPGAGAGENAAP